MSGNFTHPNDLKKAEIRGMKNTYIEKRPETPEEIAENKAHITLKVAEANRKEGRVYATQFQDTAKFRSWEYTG